MLGTTQTLEIKKKKDIISNLKMLFNDKLEHDNDEIAVEDRKIYLDPANVAGFVPKNKHTRDMLLNLFDVKENKLPPLDYHDKGGMSKYSSEYLKIVLEMTKHYDSIKLSTGKDYPLTVECDDFIFILAPRVDND